MGLVAVAVAGCSDQPSRGAAVAANAAFGSAYLEATERSRAETEAVKADGRAVLSTDPEAVLGVYRSLRTTVHDARERYLALEPPAEVRTAFAALLDVLEQQSVTLDRAIAAAEEGDNGALKSALEELASLSADQAIAHADIEGLLADASA